ncbi:hypothetical protein [Embleya sp. AB8]
MIRTHIAKATAVAALAVTPFAVVPIPAPPSAAHSDTLGWQ